MNNDSVKGGGDLNQAKIIIITIVCTTLVLLALFFIFRANIVSYLFTSIEQDIDQKIPDFTATISTEDRVVRAIEMANPSVVSVIVTKDVPVFEQYYETVNPWGLFGGFSVPRIREKGTEEQEVGGGSGFLVSSDGLIVTNRHVVEDEDARYSIVLSNGSFYQAEVVDRDTLLDIAVLKISELPEAKLPVVQFGDSESLKLGQFVIAIGNVLAEFQNSVSVGVVSGLSRSIVASDIYGNSEYLNEVIQTDAAINPGNSGGPLLNLDGEVVGVNVATSEGADNIGFALPAHLVKQVVDSVKKYGEIIRSYLGVRYVMINDDIKTAYDIEADFGALLIEGDNGSPAVDLNSPAEKAGLEAGDVIVRLDGQSLRGKDLATELRSKSVGQEISLTVIRGDTEEVFVVELGRAL